MSDPFPPNPPSPSRKFFEAIDAYANILAVAGSLGVVVGFALWFFTVLPMIGLGVMMFSLGALCVCMIGHLSVTSADPVLSLGRLTPDDTQKALLLNSASTLTRAVAPPSTFDHKFKIHEPFRKAFNEHEDILGQPKGEAEPLQHAYLAQYDKAQVIWNENAGEFYRLHMKKGIWVSAKDLLDDDLTWFDDSKNRERFGMPSGQLPPWGGPARLRAVNPKDWSIGSRHWHFYHTEGATSVQRFERGLIIGPFRRFLSDKDGAQVYTLTSTDNPKWHTSVSLGVSDLVCVEPMSLVPAPGPTSERLSVPSRSTVPDLHQEKVDGWRDMIAEAKIKFKHSGLSLFAILEQDSRFESFRRHLSTGALQALQSGTGVKAKDLRSFDDVITMLEDEIIRVEEIWGLR